MLHSCSPSCPVSSRKKSFSGLLDLLFPLPAVFLLVIWPFFLHEEQVLTHLEEESWYLPLSYTYDYFMKCKGRALCITALLCLLLMALRLVSRRKDPADTFFGSFPTKLLRIKGKAASGDIDKSSPAASGLVDSASAAARLVLACPALFFILTLLSALLSSHRVFSFQGMVESFETVWVIGAYVVIFYYAFSLVQTGGSLRLLYGSILAGSFLQGLIGLSQLCHHDFWSTRAGAFLLFLGKTQSGTLRFHFSDLDPVQIYLSFYNPNYAALYLVLILPLAMLGIRICRRLWQKLFALLLTLLLVVCLYGTRSKAGMMVFLAQLLLLLVFHLYQRGVRPRRLVFHTVLVLIHLTAAAALLIILANHTTLLPTALSEAVSDLFPKAKPYYLSQITGEKDGISFVYDDQTYYFGTKETESGLQCYAQTADGASLPLSRNEDDTYSLASSDVKYVKLSAYTKNDSSYITISRYFASWTFIKRSSDQKYYYVNYLDRLDEIVTAQTAFSTDYDRWFTQRVYIWNRTIPLLKKSLLLGTGPDTFALEFPQKDYVIRGQVDTTIAEQILTRPHSFYLQTALQEGLPALLLFLTVAVYALRSLRKILKPRKDTPAFLLLSLAGFLLMALFNDSILPVMPYVWGLLGVCCALPGRSSIFS